MKIRSKAYTYLLAGIWCCIVPNLVFTDTAFLIHQFRAPYSLSEMLHDGLVVVQDFLGQIDSYNKNPIDSLSKNPMVRNGKQSSTELLQMMNSKLEELEALYQQMHAKSVLHEFRRDERDFLQQLIDRIDHMIHQLENDEPSPQDQELIRKNLDILQSLKDQLSA